MRKEIQDRNQSTAIVDEARKLAVDVLYSEKGHFAASSWWRFVNYALGIPSVLLGVFAGASILQQEGSELLAALAALLASALTALNTFLDPSQRASQHQQTGTAYGRLRRIIRQFVQIEGLATESVSELREQLNDLTESVSDIQKDALPISKRAYTKATKSIKAGSSEYTPQELDAATGPKVAE
jgi:hypothetical protein